MSKDVDMLPAFDFFAQGVHQQSQLDSFKIANFHLPPSPWLGDTILPILEDHNSGFDFDENRKSLHLLPFLPPCKSSVSHVMHPFQ